MAEHNPQSGSPGDNDANAAALRDALIGKVRNEKGEERHPHVTPYEIGRHDTHEDTPLAKPLSFGGPSYLDRAVFCRQLATLIEVGIPMLKALQMLSVRTPNARLRRAISDTARGVEEGQPIHTAMARHARTFSPLVVNIVRVGETGGILEDSLVRMAEIMESKARIRRRIVSASMYPIIALCVAIVVVGIIMVKAIPVFAEVYETSNQELPALTQMMIGLSSFLAAAWFFILIILILAAIGLVWWGRHGGRRPYSWLALHTPVLKGINRKIAVARSTRTLASLIAAGVPLVEALKIAADTNENLIVCDALNDVHAHVQKGERMAEPLARAGVFPPLVVDMVAIGEETGTLERMLHKIADIYDAEVDSTLSGLSSIIEPILIILLGLVVVFIALAVLYPYFNLVNVVGA